jgi:regulator of RNase E activity RraA
VFPGDILVGDDEGVVVIPRHLADEVALAAARQEHKENFILSKIQAGAPLAGTYPADETIDAEYEAFCRENPPPRNPAV